MMCLVVLPMGPDARAISFISCSSELFYAPHGTLDDGIFLLAGRRAYPFAPYGTHVFDDDIFLMAGRKASPLMCCVHLLNHQITHRKKFEIATDEVGNPIKQDEKKGQLREFKKGDIFFNYGCLPVSYNADVLACLHPFLFIRQK